jgi:hypothetical protein
VGRKILAKTMAFFEISDPALRNNQTGGFGIARSKILYLGEKLNE